MQKQEFEERIERTVTDEQYKVIEEVYMWHPSIRNTSGKDEVAELYKSFGMTIFHDMLPRAKKAHELDEFLRNAQREVQRMDTVTFYDTGCDNIQFPLFRLAPNLKVAGLGHNGSRWWYWLSAVVSAAAFALCGSLGSSRYYGAAGDGGVRPYFCIG